MIENQNWAPTRVMIIDSHAIVRHGLEHLLNSQDDLSVSGSATDLTHAFPLIESTHPNVIILELFLADGHACRLQDWLNEKKLKCALVCLTDEHDPTRIHEAIASGILGFIPRKTGTATIIETIRKAARNEPHVDSDILLRAFHHSQPAASPLDTLSCQESRVLSHMAEGLTNRKIAIRMGLSEKTVKNYSSHMMAKLGVTRRTEAAALYWKHRPQSSTSALSADSA